MKNKIITLVVILGIVFSSYNSTPRQVYCVDLERSTDVQEIILQRSKEGWKLVTLTSYVKGNYNGSYFILVMER